MPQFVRCVTLTELPLDGYLCIWSNRLVFSNNLDRSYTLVVCFEEIYALVQSLTSLLRF